MESEGNKDVNRYRFKYRFKDSTIFIIHEMTKINGLASEDSKCSAFLTLNSQKFLLQKHSMSSRIQHIWLFCKPYVHMQGLEPMKPPVS